MEELWATHIREVSLLSTGIWARLPWVYFYFDFACILRARAFAENWRLVLLLETSFSITREISGTSQEIFQRSRNRKCLETSLPGNVRDPPRKCLGPSKKSWRWKEIVEELSVTIPENVWDHRRKVVEEKKLSRNCLGPSKEMFGTIEEKLRKNRNCRGIVWDHPSMEDEDAVKLSQSFLPLRFH